MRTVQELLEAKGKQVYSIGSDASVMDAARQMADRDIGALVVIDGGKIAGIVSERDYTRKTAVKGRSPREFSVKDIMTPDVVSVHPSQTIEQCSTMMLARNIRHLPVVDGDRVVGMVSIGDVMKEHLAYQEEILRVCEINETEKTFEL